MTIHSTVSFYGMAQLLRLRFLSKQPIVGAVSTSQSVTFSSIKIRPYVTGSSSFPSVSTVITIFAQPFQKSAVIIRREITRPGSFHAIRVVAIEIIVTSSWSFVHVSSAASESKTGRIVDVTSSWTFLHYNRLERVVAERISIVGW